MPNPFNIVSLGQFAGAAQTAQNLVKDNFVPDSQMIAFGNKMPSRWHARRIRRRTLFVTWEADQPMPTNAPSTLVSYAKEGSLTAIRVNADILLLRTELSTFVYVGSWLFQSTLANTVVLGLAVLPPGTPPNFQNNYYTFSLHSTNLLLHAHTYHQSTADSTPINKHQSTVQSWSLDEAMLIERGSLLTTAFGWKWANNFSNGLYGALGTFHYFEL